MTDPARLVEAGRPQRPERPDLYEGLPATGPRRTPVLRGDAAREAIKDAQAKSPRIGLVSLCCNVPTPDPLDRTLQEDVDRIACLMRWLLHILPIAVLLLQPILLIVLVDFEFGDSETGWCPQGGNWSLRAAKTGAAFLVWCRFLQKTVVFFSLYRRSLYGEGTFWYPCGRGVQGSSFDFRWGEVFELLVNMVSLRLIFTQTKVVDVVLNCLAADFIGKLDDEYKALVLEKVPEVADELVDREVESHNRECVEPGPEADELSDLGNLLSLTGAQHLIYLAVCVYFVSCAGYEGPASPGPAPAASVAAQMLV